MCNDVSVKYMFIMFTTIGLIGCRDHVTSTNGDAHDKTSYGVYYKKELQSAYEQEGNIEVGDMLSNRPPFANSSAYALRPLKQAYQQQSEIEYRQLATPKTYQF